MTNYEKYCLNLSKVLGHTIFFNIKQKYSPNGEADNIYNAASFAWWQDNGAAVGNPASGTTRVGNIPDFNWKNADDSIATLYSAAPITAGNNSYEKFIFGGFSGSYNSVLNGLWAHTGGNLGAGLTVKCVISGTGQGSYTTPSTATNANLKNDLTSTGLISTGLSILYGSDGPAQSGKGSSTSSNPAYTQYIITQLQTTTAANPGDVTTTLWLLQYSEN